LLNIMLTRWVNPIWPEDDMTRRSGILARHWALHQAKARFQQPDVGQVCPTYITEEFRMNAVIMMRKRLSFRPSPDKGRTGGVCSGEIGFFV
jgi:hypothetical protein